jgi:hypothetical protein
MYAKWPKAHRKLVEDKANGTAVIETLRHEISGIIAVEPEGGKEARAHAVSDDEEPIFRFPFGRAFGNKISATGEGTIGVHTSLPQISARSDNFNDFRAIGVLRRHRFQIWTVAHTHNGIHSKDGLP